MAFAPTNVTGTVITWAATARLRLLGKKRKDAVLQQQWRNASTGETEWRDVELVHPTDGDQ